MAVGVDQSTGSRELRRRLALRLRHPRQEIHLQPHNRAPEPHAAESENRLW